MSERQKSHENHFMEMLDDLFDISHVDALQIVSIKENRQFLLNQRKKGREGSEIRIDHILAEKEMKLAIRQKEEDRRSQCLKKKSLQDICSRYGKF
ncbi:UNVERIFIED_CONTAM: hypothetical protein RMT77_009127 [Armadillidium vulgare]